MVFLKEDSKRKWVLRGAGLFFSLLIAWVVVVFLIGVLGGSRGEARADINYYYDVVGGDPVVALTFDDGPDPVKTRQVVEVLERHGAPATFFFLGENAIKHPQVVKDVADAGFEIGNHTFTHSSNVHSSPERLKFELSLTNEIVENVTGKPTRFYRPPYLLGIESDPIPDPKTPNEPMQWAMQSGYLPVGVDIDSKDWEAHSVQDVVDKFMEDLSHGHIALFHDTGQSLYTVEALEQIIIELREQGYDFVTLPALIGLNSGQEEKTNSVMASINYPGRSIRRLSIFASSLLGRGIMVLAGTILIVAAARMMVVMGLSLLAAGKRRRVRRPYKGQVSVVVPAYNEEENIGATLESIISNGDVVKEIVVVDDGSSDGTAQVIKSVRRKYPNKIKFISISNGGKARALNIGIRETVSDIVVTTDADSIFDSKALGRLAAHFSDPRVAAVAGKIYVTDSNRLLNAFQYLEYTVGQNLDKRAFSLLNAVSVVPGPIGAWRKADILAAGGYSLDTLVEDQDLTLAMLAAGKKVIYEPAAMSYTEAPHTVRDFTKQRFRWIFGTVQCAWKYKSYLFSLKARSLGWIVLPHTFVFGIFLPLIYPVMGALLALSLVFSFWREVLAVYLIFLAFDFTYAAFGFVRERGRLYSLGLLPVQRVFYHLVICYVVAKSVVKAIDGSEALWNKVQKRGEVQSLQFTRTLLR